VDETQNQAITHIRCSRIQEREGAFDEKNREPVIASAPITPRAELCCAISFDGPALDAMKLERILAVPHSLDEEYSETFISLSL